MKEENRAINRNIPPTGTIIASPRFKTSAVKKVGIENCIVKPINKAIERTEYPREKLAFDINKIIIINITKENNRFSIVDSKALFIFPPAILSSNAGNNEPRVGTIIFKIRLIIMR